MWSTYYNGVLVMILITRVAQLLALQLFWFQRTPESIIFNYIALGIGLIYEMIQMRVYGVSGYFKSLLNYLDLAAYLSGIIWISYYIKIFNEQKSLLHDTEDLNLAADLEATSQMRNDPMKIFMALVWSVGVCFRGMEFNLILSSLRTFYVILIESFKDAQSFLVIVAEICFIFALITSIIDIGDPDKLILLE